MKDINTIRLSACPESRKGMHHEGNFGDYLKMIYWDDTGLCLFAKKLEQGTFAWPPIMDESMSLSQGQLAMLMEGIDWRRTFIAPSPQRPAVA